MPDEDDTSWIVVTVEKAWFTKSPWDAYVKHFPNEKAFLDWWTSLGEDSYTRKLANVRVFWSIEDHSLIAPSAPPQGTET